MHSLEKYSVVALGMVCPLEAQRDRRRSIRHRSITTTTTTTRPSLQLRASCSTGRCGLFSPFLLVLLFLNFADNKYQCYGWLISHTPNQKIGGMLPRSFGSQNSGLRTAGSAKKPNLFIKQQQQQQQSVHMLPQSELAWTSATTAADLNDYAIFQLASPTVLLFAALVLGIAANGWIQRLLSGDQGLGSFLSDGSGFNKSGFKPVTNDEDRAVRSDPLPWLRLPKLDFVEVAGQEELAKEDYEKGRLASNQQYNDVLIQLDNLRERMNEKLAEGNIEEAKALRKDLEKMMKENNIQFFKD